VRARPIGAAAARPPAAGDERERGAGRVCERVGGRRRRFGRERDLVASDDSHPGHDPERLAGPERDAVTSA
jgi:hypothetical protein